MTENSPLAERIQRIKTVVSRMSDDECSQLAHEVALLRVAQVLREWNTFKAVTNPERVASLAAEVESGQLGTKVAAFPVKASLEELLVVLFDEHFERVGEDPPENFFITLLDIE